LVETAVTIGKNALPKENIETNEEFVHTDCATRFGTLTGNDVEKEIDDLLVMSMKCTMEDLNRLK
jgi:hypothetical protein